MTNPYAPLFAPVKIGQLRLKNRIVMSPMTTRLGDVDHQVTERMIDYLAERAKGGAAMVTTEAFYVARRFAGPNTVALDSNEKIPMLASLCEAVHAQGAKICVQLGCGLGRYDAFGRNGEPPKTAAAIPSFYKPEINCAEMTHEDIQQVVKEYGKAAQRVAKAGGDAINIHGHNGYLIDQFMSAQFNTRTDEYGGSLENRMRYPKEIIAAVRKSVGPKIPIIFRFSVDLCFAGSRGMEESLEMLKYLEGCGVDALHLDTGATEPMDWILTPHFLGEACELYVAEAARKAGIRLPILNSGAHDPQTALKAVGDGILDCVMMGRALVADPQLPNKLMRGAREEVRPCLRCNEFCSKRSLSTGAYLTCAVNPAAGNERRLSLVPAREKKRIAVIGAGPSGMEAARCAALCGHEVTVFEREQESARLLRHVARAPFKSQMKRLLEWQAEQLEKLGVTVCYGRNMTADAPELAQADVIFVATGSVPAALEIPGRETALPIRKAYLDLDQISGESVLIAGGNLSACELALELAERGKRVTLVERQKRTASDCYGINRTSLNRMMKEKGVASCTLHTVSEMAPGVLRAINGQGESVTLTGDVVIDALGSTEDLTLAEELERVYPGRVRAIGSCENMGSVGSGIRSAYFAVHSIS